MPIAIWANNVPEWLYTQYGTGKMGAVLVTVNTSYKSFELEYLLEQSDASTLVFIGGVRESDEYLKVIENICPELDQCEPGKLNCERLPRLKNLVHIGPEETVSAIDSKNWLHTGDLAVMDENGYCKITGRIKDMIIRGGENVYPREIEEFLFTHPKVMDVQVIGVPSERYGEEVVAYIHLSVRYRKTLFVNRSMK